LKGFCSLAATNDTVARSAEGVTAPVWKRNMVNYWRVNDGGRLHF